MDDSVAAALRLVLVTDGVGDPDRLVALGRAAVAGGVRAIQLREDKLPARALIEVSGALRPHLRQVGGILLVNDRADVVAAGHADGVHLGRRSLLPSQARRFLDVDTIVGCSAHDIGELEEAAAEGADYASLSPVFETRSKPGARALGAPTARQLAERSPVPVVWLGGIDRHSILDVAPLQPFGVAVMSAICRADDPRTASAHLVAALDAELSSRGEVTRS